MRRHLVPKRSNRRRGNIHTLLHGVINSISNRTRFPLALLWSLVSLYDVTRDIGDRILNYPRWKIEPPSRSFAELREN